MVDSIDIASDNINYISILAQKRKQAITIINLYLAIYATHIMTPVLLVLLLNNVKTNKVKKETVSTALPCHANFPSQFPIYSYNYPSICLVKYRARVDCLKTKKESDDFRKSTYQGFFFLGTEQLRYG